MNGSGELFADDPACAAAATLRPGALLLRGFMGEEGAALFAALAAITQQSPLRHMKTPGGFRMSVSMTNCGSLGWVAEPRGYRYTHTDPLTGRPWPPMPAAFAALAARAAACAGFGDFTPDVCLVNRYAPGARLSLHQDKDERDLTQPIVSVSLGLPAQFQFGGLKRSECLRRVPLRHGDVVVWGGPARLCYHGVLPLALPEASAAFDCRINLTLRRAA